uniref:Secreted protein n=1 Tax=Steinernema glaseri TaxID=37863 RepID=A0A1I7ZSN5_9BILA
MYFDMGGLKKYLVLFYLIGLNKCLANIFVYTIRQVELRKTFWHYVRKISPTKITPVTYTSTVRPVQVKGPHS